MSPLTMDNKSLSIKVWLPSFLGYPSLEIGGPLIFHHMSVVVLQFADLKSTSALLHLFVETRRLPPL